MLQSVFDLGDTIVREVMVPRTEVVWIEEDKSLRQALHLATRSGFSRIPVVGEDVDDVLGVAYIKDMIARALALDPGERGPMLGEVMRAPVFVPESKNVDALLREMQRDRTHFAIVVDEYGGTAGIVTIEDLLEEIVGEITDEYDAETPAPITALPDGSTGCRPGCRWRISGSCSTSNCPTTTSTPSVACWPSCSAGFRCPARRHRSTPCTCSANRASTAAAGRRCRRCWCGG